MFIQTSLSKCHHYPVAQANNLVVFLTASPSITAHNHQVSVSTGFKLSFCLYVNPKPLFLPAALQEPTVFIPLCYHSFPSAIPSTILLPVPRKELSQLLGGKWTLSCPCLKVISDCPLLLV